MSIEDATKKLKKFCDYEDSVVLIDNALIEIQDAIKIVLGNLEALCDMQKTADRELENARRINEEHKRENGLLREKVKKIEEIVFSNIHKGTVFKDEYIYPSDTCQYVVRRIVKELLQESEEK